MANNKKELREKINKLPLFEKRAVFVANSPEEEEKQITKQFHLAVCEIGKHKSYAYVTPLYRLLQFRELFTPILDSIKEEVIGYLIHNGGFAMLKFFPEMDQLKDGNDRFGLIAMNSVDKSTSITVKFCVRHNERHFTIPTDVAGLKKPHTGKAADLTKNYIKFLGTVKETWKTIINEFPNYHIVLDESEKHDENKHYLLFGKVAEKLKLGIRKETKLREYFDKVKDDGKEFTLWDFFIKAFELIEDVNYKSEVHKEKKIDSLSRKLFEYSMILEI